MRWLQREATGRQIGASLLFGPAKPLEVEAVVGVEHDAFLFEQASLEGVAAIAGGRVGHLSLRIDDAMPGNLDCGVEMLKDVSDEAGSPGQSGQRGDLAVGGHPTLGDAADDCANRRDGFVALGQGSVG